MPGLVPGIHVFLALTSKTWMAGTSPAVTEAELSGRLLSHLGSLLNAASATFSAVMPKCR